MLNFIMRTFYHDKIYTTEPELAYKMYKWPCGLFTLLALRRILGIVIFAVIGLLWLIFIKPRVYGLGFIDVSLIFLWMQLREAKKNILFSAIGARTPAQIRTIRIERFIRKFVTTNGKALGGKEWKEIKKHDFVLYNDLLSDNCNHCCYYYSLKIARIIKDSTLIWGAMEDPFDEGLRYYAHAVIYRNGYIYDSNMRQSEKYEDFIKLYKFKLYKQWKYDEYSKEDFRESERAEFRRWCKENNVLKYEKF